MRYKKINKEENTVLEKKDELKKYAILGYFREGY